MTSSTLSPHIAPPLIAQCDSLAEVRLRIDQADRLLVALLAERAHYVRQAARFKQTPADVQTPQRVQTVIGQALAQARQVGAPPAVVEATYRAMITAFVQEEARELDRLADRTVKVDAQAAAS